MLSKPYLDGLYQTIDQIEEKEEQERKAQEIMARMGSDNNDSAKE